MPSCRQAQQYSTLNAFLGKQVFCFCRKRGLLRGKGNALFFLVVVQSYTKWINILADKYSPVEAVEIVAAVEDKSEGFAAGSLYGSRFPEAGQHRQGAFERRSGFVDAV